MPRIRTIKPDFFASESIALIQPHRARLTFVGLWTQVDDEGRLRDRPTLIKAALWPWDDDVTVDHVEADLAVLHTLGRITRYTAAPRPAPDVPARAPVPLLQVTNFDEHQRISRPTPSLYPGPDDPADPDEPDTNGRNGGGVREGSWRAHGGLTEAGIPAGQNTCSERSLSAQGALTRGSGRGSGSGSGKGGGARASAPGPAPRCRRHAHLPEDDPGPSCVGCRSVRLRQEREAEEAVAAAAAAEREQRRAEQFAQRNAPRPTAGRGRELARAVLAERRAVGG